MGNRRSQATSPADHAWAGIDWPPGIPRWPAATVSAMPAAMAIHAGRSAPAAIALPSAMTSGKPMASPSSGCQAPVWAGASSTTAAPARASATAPHAATRADARRWTWAWTGIPALNRLKEAPLDPVLRRYAAMTPSISTIPQLGFGVFQVPPEDTAEVVAEALRTGYRHVDTAAAYQNEAGVGEAVRASGLDRGEVFITTKCWNDSQGRERSRRALEKSLERLGTDYVDLYLIHWPAPAKDLYVETWEALVQAQSDGLANAVGVSNFQPAHLERIIEATGVTPAVNQVELHPRFAQSELRAVHERLGIVTEAWSPLAQGQVLDDPVIGRIAEAHGRSPGQVVLRWHIQLGNVVIPKSVTPERIAENFDVFSFELTA